MAVQVLILGGCGRIGRSVARDLITHTQAEITITSRNPELGSWIRAELGQRAQFLALDLDNHHELWAAVQSLKDHTTDGSALVIHCAGPFRYRDGRVLRTCIDQGVNYLDVSDDPDFTRSALSRRPEAAAAGVTAVVNSGVFPGISNSLARLGVEQMDEATTIGLNYVVAGSGGAGVTVMRTTFLELQTPFQVWLEGRYQAVEPYSEREVVEFPPPYGRAAVYWFSTVEAYTLPQSFPVKTVMTKFGSLPDFYNHLTWLTARLPRRWLQQPDTIEFLAEASYQMTRLTDRFSGIGIGLQVEVRGQKDGLPARYVSTMVHDNTATAAGYGTGCLAQFLLNGELQQSGVWPVEQILPTPLFEQAMHQRRISIQKGWQTLQ